MSLPAEKEVALREGYRFGDRAKHQIDSIGRWIDLDE